ncbi:ribonuclease H-like domain-containing protein [Lentinula raphanica]|nr:ribonuclease H-like domain-containing protein [Lentinula raphanica]
MSQDLLSSSLAALSLDENNGQPSSTTATPSVLSIQFVLCDTPESFSIAIHALKLSLGVVVDCEGLDLGRQNGRLSLLSIRSIPPLPNPSINYIFDFLCLPSSLLQPLFALLSSSSVLKIVFDGRMDYSALYHEYGVVMENVLDLQLVDVASRYVRGERPECTGQHRSRLAGCFGYASIRREKEVFKNVQVLQGLGGCMIEHKCVMTTGGKKQINHDIWMDRPVPDEHLQYAAHDVEMIYTLYAHLTQQGYINPYLRILLYQSKRYVSIWSDAPPVSGDDYRSHPILPLEIIDAFPENEYGSRPTKGTIVCGGCARTLTTDSFPRLSRTAAARRYCFVCYVLPKYLETRIMRQEQREREKKEKKEKREKKEREEREKEEKEKELLTPRDSNAAQSPIHQSTTTTAISLSASFEEKGIKNPDNEKDAPENWRRRATARPGCKNPDNEKDEDKSPSGGSLTNTSVVPTLNQTEWSQRGSGTSMRGSASGLASGPDPIQTGTGRRAKGSGNSARGWNPARGSRPVHGFGSAPASDLAPSPASASAPTERGRARGRGRGTGRGQGTATGKAREEEEETERVEGDV